MIVARISRTMATIPSQMTSSVIGSSEGISWRGREAGVE